MAFKRERIPLRGKILPVSLIDVVFLLLVFFLVTNLISQIGRTEQRFYVRTPENIPGVASICIQIIDESKYLWLDSEIGDEIHRRLKERYGAHLYKVSHKVMTDLIVEELKGLPRFNWEQLRWRAEEFKRSVERRNTRRPGVIEEHYFLIRCPDDYPYHRLLDLLKMIKFDEQGRGIEYLSYGTTGGNIEDIFQTRQATFKLERVGSAMMRRVLTITFQGRP